MKAVQPVILAVLALAFLLASAEPHEARAQDNAVITPKSGAKAFGLSILIPGLGQRYINGGRWGGSGTVFLTADITLWLGLATSIAQENHSVEAYTNLVALKSGNTLEGKNRAFELALGSYDSSEDYVAALLRSRQWDRLEVSGDPSRQWNWESEADRQRYLELRDDADSAGNRKTALIGALIVNRLISGITAALSSRTTREQSASFSAGFQYSRQSNLPVARIGVRF